MRRPLTAQPSGAERMLDLRKLVQAAEEHVFGWLYVFDAALYVEVSSYCNCPPS